MNLKSPKIIDYHVVQSSNIEKFEKEIKEYIAEGWECQGGFTAFEEWSEVKSSYIKHPIEIFNYTSNISDRQIIFYQALVKYDVG